jgi:hypothetical protein
MAVPRLRQSGGDIALAGHVPQAACPHKGFASVSDRLLMPMNQEDGRVWAISAWLRPEQLNLLGAVLAMWEYLSPDHEPRAIDQRPFFCDRTLPEQEQDQHGEKPCVPPISRKERTPHPDPF